jgi:ATP-dependent helicase HrpB
MKDEEPLPIETIRPAFNIAVDKGPVVITSPTGSGKSTAVPRWCAKKGRVLVIEPRRVACRGLASRVAELEGCALGLKVGYAVRDDSRYCDETSILFATPGVVLRYLADGRSLSFDIVIIDEFHERSLDVDLLAALLLMRFSGPLVIMSATMDADRIAAHVKGLHLTADTRRFPVSEVFIPGKTLLPDSRGLAERVEQALTKVPSDAGDVLIFLPGKAEIAALSRRLSEKRHFEILEIHGGLSLEAQSRVFVQGAAQRVILATNVAETSITIPNIGVVVDSGLVKRNRFFNGRGYLTEVPIALDSAAQRAGRAGRLRPGICFRLWSKEAVLDPITPPEIYRESLDTMLLAAAACGATVDELPFLDRPKPYAVEAAKSAIFSLGAIGSDARITERGRRLFGLPLDPAQGALLVEAERLGCIEDAVDLIAAEAVGRPLFVQGRRPENEQNDLRAPGCDAVAHILAVRMGDAAQHGLDPFVLKEARAVRKRLRDVWSLTREIKEPTRIERSLLIEAALAADPRCAYIARRRRGRVFWANGGTEITLGRSSAVDESKADAVLVLSSMALGTSLMDTEIFATCAMPVTFSALSKAELGEETVSHAAKDKGVVTAQISRVFAGAVIDTREEIPTGGLARDAIAAIFLRDGFFRKSREAAEQTLIAAALARALTSSHKPIEAMDLGVWQEVDEVLSLEAWVKQKLVALGVSSGADFSLLSPEDFLPPTLPEETRARLDRDFPRRLSLGDVKYDILYDLANMEATLVMTEGTRQTPPPLSTLPRLKGFRIRAKHHSKVWVLKEKDR